MQFVMLPVSLRCVGTAALQISAMANGRIRADIMVPALIEDALERVSRL
jgi:hypothetical protein